MKAAKLQAHVKLRLQNVQPMHADWLYAQIGEELSAMNEGDEQETHKAVLSHIRYYKGSYGDF